MANANILNQFENKPFATLGELMDAKRARETDQLRNDVARQSLQIQQQKLQKEQADEQKAQQRSALAQEAFTKFSRPDGSIDQKAVIAYIQPKDYEAAQSLSKYFDAQRKEEIDAKTKELDAREKSWNLIGRAVQSANPNNFSMVRATVKSLEPELGDYLGETFDPERVKTVLAMGTARNEHDKNMRDALTDSKDYTETALKMIANAHDEQHFQEAQAFARSMSVDDDLATRGFSQWTPDAPQRAAALLLGPQRETAAAGFTLSPGQTRYDAQGKPIASKAPTAPSGGSGAGAGLDVSSRLPPQALAVYDRVLVNVPGTRVGAIKQGMNRLAASGASEDQMKDFLKYASVETLGQADKTAMIGRMQTLTALKDAETLLREVPTNYLRGTWEDTMRALGTTSDPKLVQLGTQMGTILANYMRSISGAAIAESEAARLSKLIPNYRNTLTVNKNQIQGFSDALRSFDNAFYQYKFGDNYDWVMGTGALKGGGSAAPAGGRKDPLGIR